MASGMTAATPEQIEYLETAVLESALPALRGLDCVTVNRNIPPWVQEITRDRVLEIKQKADIISKRGDYKRVTVGKKRKTRYIFQIGLGFSINERDILSGQAGNGEPLPTLNARKISRKVAEGVDNLIFNGVPDLGMPGLATGDGIQHATCAKPWDSPMGADPYDDVLNAVIKLTEGDNEFTNQIMAIHPTLWKRAMKKDINGNRYSDQILELFPRGANAIVQTKALGTNILIGDAGPDIAVADVQEDIRTLTFPMTSNEVQDWNVRSKVGIDVHEESAFVLLGGASATV